MGSGPGCNASIKSVGTADLGSEAELIVRAKQGDTNAFETLYRLYKRRVYSVCLRMTANTAVAEDLTQEVFLQLFRKIASFRGESALGTWLHRVTVNAVLMRFRKKELVTVPLDPGAETDEEVPNREIGAQDLTLSGSIDRLQLERAIPELPFGYRIVFVLHDVEGYEHHEIAEMIGCTIGNSKSQLHRARLRLRRLLRMRTRQPRDLSFSLLPRSSATPLSVYLRTACHVEGN